MEERMSHHVVSGHSLFLSLFPRVAQKFGMSQIQNSCVKSSNRFLCLLGGWVGAAASFVCFSVYCKRKWMEVLLLMMMALYTCNQIRAMGNLVDDKSCLFFPIATKEEQMGNLSG